MSIGKFVGGKGGRELGPSFFFGVESETSRDGNREVELDFRLPLPSTTLVFPFVATLPRGRGEGIGIALSLRDASMEALFFNLGFGNGNFCCTFSPIGEIMSIGKFFGEDGGSELGPSFLFGVKMDTSGDGDREGRFVILVNFIFAKTLDLLGKKLGS